MVNREKLRKFGIELGLFALQVVFSKISLCGVSFGVGLPFAFVRVFYGANLITICLEYAVAELIQDFALYNLFFIGYEIVVLSVYYFSIEYINTKKKTLLLMIFNFISQALNLYFVIVNIKALMDFLICLGIHIVALFYFKKLYCSYKKKFVFCKLSRFDYILFSVLLMIVCLGFFSLEFMTEYIIILVSIFLILFSCKIMPNDKILFVSLVMLLCVGIVTDKLIYILYGIILILIGINFGLLNKYIYLCMMMIGTGLCVFINGDYSNVYAIIGLGFPFLICGLIPERKYLKISRLFQDKTIDILQDNLYIEKIGEIREKLEKMSKTFFLMRENFKFLLVGKIDRKIASQELAKDVIKKSCEICPNYKFCTNSNIDRINLISENILYAIEKGKIYFEELGGGVKTYCVKSNVIVNEINNIASQFLAYEKSLKSEDESKLLIASELENFAKIFENLAKTTQKTLNINKNLSFMIRELLLNDMIDVHEVAVVEQANAVDRIEVVADNELVLRKELQMAIKRILKCNVKMIKLQHLELSGMSQVTYIPEMSLNCSFALATNSKENTNGDNLIITKMSEDKYFVAIADGMGHGKNANRISKMVLELVMSMFSVGMDLNLIIESVNKLLIPIGLDNFSTLDICVIDLNFRIGTFIKLGSSVSILKHKMTSESIVCKSLPVGIVQNIKPTIIQKRISDGDIIFLASDGVVDSFGDIEHYKNFINDAKIYNLQKYVDTVMDDIVASNPEHRDDMSIIAINLLKNNRK